MIFFSLNQGRTDGLTAGVKMGINNGNFAQDNME